ncbi:hypothetical protein BDR06DRAFT_616540 [Suillus hirtellus]|nr:hypothetical protein BDR06DRAFT_616540 [Suillus hirtellus]
MHTLCMCIMFVKSVICAPRIESRTFFHHSSLSQPRLDTAIPLCFKSALNCMSRGLKYDNHEPRTPEIVSEA